MDHSNKAITTCNMIRTIKSNKGVIDVKDDFTKKIFNPHACRDIYTCVHKVEMIEGTQTHLISCQVIYTHLCGCHAVILKGARPQLHALSGIYILCMHGCLPCLIAEGISS